MLRRKGRLERTILTAVAASGTLAVAALAPNAMKLLKFVPANKHNFGYRTRTVAQRLIDQGFLKREKRADDYVLRITEKGQEKLELAEEKMQLPTPDQKRWDQRWRMVMFDIPEPQRKIRDRLRIMVEGAGFYRFQDSAWVYPHACEEFVTLLKAELHIGANLQYLVIEKIENDQKLREHFKLPR